jgi:hypothetical protein
MMKLTANLIVDSIEASLPFWVDRLGFEKTVEVQHQDSVGFVILKHGDVELMLQSQLSLAADVPPLAQRPYASVLYLEVADLAPIRRALVGWPAVIPERKTFYGATEIVVKVPGDHVVFFASHA